MKLQACRKGHFKVATCGWTHLHLPLLSPIRAGDQGLPREGDNSVTDWTARLSRQGLGQLRELCLLFFLISVEFL